MSDTFTVTKSKAKTKISHATEKSKGVVAKTATKVAKPGQTVFSNQERDLLNISLTSPSTASLPSQLSKEYMNRNPSAAATRTSTAKPCNTPPASSVITATTTVTNTATHTSYHATNSITSDNVPATVTTTSSFQKFFPGACTTTLPSSGTLPGSQSFPVFEPTNMVPRNCSDLMRSMAAKYNDTNNVK